MKKNLSLKRNLRIGIVILGLSGLSTLSFNCAPGLFKSADHSEESSSVGGQGSTPSFDKPKAPWVLMTSEQVFQTMLNVTGQPVPTAAQRTEFDARTGALAGTDNLTNLNAPLALGATSLAGEVCNGLIVKESVANAVRKFFVGVNFGANPAANNAQAFANATSVMARSFYGRELKAEEASILSAFYTDFIAGATAVDNTKDLYLSACAAMLSSTDALTY